MQLFDVASGNRRRKIGRQRTLLSIDCKAGGSQSALPVNEEGAPLSFPLFWFRHKSHADPFCRGKPPPRRWGSRDFFGGFFFLKEEESSVISNWLFDVERKMDSSADFVAVGILILQFELPFKWKSFPSEFYGNFRKVRFSDELTLWKIPIFSANDVILVFALEHFCLNFTSRQDQKWMWQRLTKYLNAASTVLTDVAMSHFPFDVFLKTLIHLILVN